MTKNKQIKSLFNQLCLDRGLNNHSETPDYNKAGLVMDYNSVYGGYRIETIKGDGGSGQGFFAFSSRFSAKEMTAFLQGLLTK